jgi:DNA-binding HxlR family transcriptional regulator
MKQPTAPHLDKALFQPTRLAVVAHLVACGGETSFAQIRAALGKLSHALLWSHGQVLERAGYIEVRKHIEGRQVQTTVVLTDLGRRAFADHRAALTAITMEDVA